MNRYSGQHKDELSLEPGDLVKHHDGVDDHDHIHHDDDVVENDCDLGAASRRAGDRLVVR